MPAPAAAAASTPAPPAPSTSPPPPITWCWWDPWWGYVCSTSYPTDIIDAFSYQATLGLRYEFDNDQTFMRLGYTSLWMDFDASSGTPRFDVFVLDIGWMF